MIREEKIKRLKALKSRCERLIVSSDRGPEEWRKDAEALDLALTALRPVSREQVEKVRGEWITKHYVDGILEGTNFDECSKCGYQRVFENPELKTKYMFCPGCGRAMWDEAVDMVMERLEAMRDE